LTALALGVEPEGNRRWHHLQSDIHVPLLFPGDANSSVAKGGGHGEARGSQFLHPAAGAAVVKDAIKQFRAANDESGVRMWTLIDEELPRMRTELSPAKGPASNELLR
jgi:hypothetical protein